MAELRAGSSGAQFEKEEGKQAVSDSSGVYICKSIVKYLRHGNYICKSEGIHLANEHRIEIPVHM